MDTQQSHQQGRFSGPSGPGYESKSMLECHLAIDPQAE